MINKHPTTNSYEGFVEDLGQYRALLARADVVLSTALHDFQGLSILEATAAGCLPLVPDRLAYPEIFPPCCRYASYPEEPQREAEAAMVTLETMLGDPPPAQALEAGVAPFTLAALAPRYRGLLEEVAAG